MIPTHPHPPTATSPKSDMKTFVVNLIFAVGFGEAGGGWRR